MKPSCETCTYWVPVRDVYDYEVNIAPNIRACSVNPPTIIAPHHQYIETVNVWPRTTSNSVCGAWQNRDVS